MQHITVEQLKARIDSGEKPHLLDVREAHERADFNIGGTHLPLGQIQSMAIEDIEDLKEEEVIIYCRSGVRSQQAAMMLDQMGFKNTVNLKGGLVDWEAKYGR